MSAPTDLSLAADFPAATEDDWRELVAGVLRRSGVDEGEDPVAALSSTTYDGLAIRPLYTSAPDAPRTAVIREAWDVRAQHRDPDPTRANEAIRLDLERGATSLWLLLGDGGLPVSALGAALDGVYLDLAPIALDAGGRTREASAALLELVADGSVTGSLGADPIGWQARTGEPADLAVLGELAESARPHQGLRVATVDATVFHDAGASDATELAVAASIGVAYLRALVDAGLAIENALALLDFRFAVTADQFGSIAKLRAARRMWARVAELSGAAGATQYQHAVTSAAMLTRRDPWVNLLRETIACAAAAIGGADAITVLPFDSAVGLPDDLARRIARNTQAILHDEASLGRVADAAGGSYYVDSLTAELAEQAWSQFAAIERAGGALADLDAIAERVAGTRTRRAADVAHRRAPLTGVSEFAFPDEKPLARNEIAPPAHGGAFPLARWAEPFEALRDEVEALDPRPTVFLAALGPLAAHSARVGFARNLFNAGGFRIVTGPVEEFAASAARVACVCSSDTVYADEAAPAAAQLRAGGAALVWLAGKQGFDGVDGNLFAGCDALAALRATLDAAQDAEPAR